MPTRVWHFHLFHRDPVSMVEPVSSHGWLPAANGCTVHGAPWPGRPWLSRFNEAGLFYSRRHVRQGPPLQPRRAARIINAHCYAATPGCCRASSRGALAARTRLAVSHQAHRPPPTASHAVPLTSPHLHPPTRLSRHPTARDTRRATRPLAHATRGQVSRQNLAGVSTVSRRFRLNG